MEASARIARRILLAERLAARSPAETVLMACDLTDFARRLSEAADRVRD